MTITRNYSVRIYGALTAGGAEAVLATGPMNAQALTCDDNYSVFALTVNGVSPNAGDAIYEAALAAPSDVLEGASNGGLLGELAKSDVMVRSGGNLLPADVRNDTSTGAAAGGTLDISADNPQLPAAKDVRAGVDRGDGTKGTLKPKRLAFLRF